MSIVYTADVFCDGIVEEGKQCPIWTHGVSGSTVPGKTLARTEHAPREGWAFHKGKDYCPTCAKQMGLTRAKTA